MTKCWPGNQHFVIVIGSLTEFYLLHKHHRREGKNRQIRRMTAAAGYPTLRLIRSGIGPWTLDGILPGQFRPIDPPPIKDLTQTRVLEQIVQTGHMNGVIAPDN
jgi:hypothetical protein